MPLYNPAPTVPAPTLVDPNQRIFEPQQGLVGSSSTFLTASGTLYCAYLGCLNTAQAFGFIRFWITNIGAGAQTAEAGLFSSPAAPNGAGQTFTALTTSAVGSMLVPGLNATTSTMAGTTIPAGTHLWVGIRTAMVTTQPTFANPYFGDWSRGAALSRSGSVAIAVGTTYVMSLITASATGGMAPRLVVTLD